MITIFTQDEKHFYEVKEIHSTEKNLFVIYNNISEYIDKNYFITTFINDKQFILGGYDTKEEQKKVINEIKYAIFKGDNLYSMP